MFNFFMIILIYLKSIVSTIAFAIGTFFFASSGVILNLIFNSRKIDNLVVEYWGKSSCWFLNVKVHITGIENYLNTQGAVILFNHSSFVDVLAMAGYLPNMRFGAKIELFKIPIFGACMKRLGTLPIARHKREDVFKVYEMAQKEFKKGYKFSLSPEGGRHDGEVLAPFKSGPFVFAINAQVDLVPVIIKGAHKIWAKGKIFANSDQWSRKVEIVVLQPVSTHGYSLDQRHLLQNKLYQLMNAELRSLK